MAAKFDLADLSASRFLALFLVCFAIVAVPLLVVATLPLVDYPNHLARMHIIAAYDRVPALREFYALSWRPVPNLAMDLIVPGLARIMPLEWAGKIFFLLTFLLTAGGTAAIHRLLFRRWSAWPLLAFLVLYNRSLLWGFGNFLFGVGLALVAVALWIGLRHRPARRLAAALVLAPAVFFAHFFAFGAYGLLILGYEVARLRQERRLVSASALRDLAMTASQFVLPLAVLIATRGGGAAEPISYSRFFRKLDLLFNIVDNYVPWLDVLTLTLLVGLFVLGAMRRRIALSPVMVLPLLALGLAQVAMPNRILGAAGVDHRMPLILALVLVAASQGALPDRRQANAVAALLAFIFLVRIAVITTTWIEQDRILAPMVAALDHLPPGSRLAVAYPPAAVHVSRREPPLLHLAALAVIGADAFVPTLFADPGQQPLTLRPPYAALADAASPDNIWDFFATGRSANRARVADALGHYDFVLVVDPINIAPPGLELRAEIVGAQLYAIRAAPR